MFNIKKFKFKVYIAKKFHKWWSKSSEIAVEHSKKLSFPTLNANTPPVPLKASQILPAKTVNQPD